jgi:hypothetical protein
VTPEPTLYSSSNYTLREKCFLNSKNIEYNQMSFLGWVLDIDTLDIDEVEYRSMKSHYKMLQILIRAEECFDYDTIFREYYNVYPREFLILLFFARDCRGGHGRKDIFRIAFKWLMKEHEDIVFVLMPVIPHYTSYKEWLEIFCGEDGFEDEMVSLMCKQLNRDLENPVNMRSLAIKYAPRKGKRYDKYYNIVSKFLKYLNLNSYAEYKSQYLKPLEKDRPTILEHHLKLKYSSLTSLTIPRILHHPRYEKINNICDELF